MKLKLPVLLHHSGDSARLITENTRARVKNMGVLVSLNELRQRWWITKGRATAKRYIRKCCICKRYQEGLYSVSKISPLSEFKVQKMRLFKRTGIDYFGPVTLKLMENEVHS